MGRWIAAGKLQPLTSTREAIMPAFAPASDQAAIHVNLAAIFVSLELSRSTWLITSLSPGGGDKMSKHSVRGGDAVGLLEQAALPFRAAAAGLPGRFLRDFRSAALTFSEGRDGGMSWPTRRSAVRRF